MRLTYVYTHVTTTPIKLKNISSPLKMSSSQLQAVSPQLPAPGNHRAAFCHYRLICPLQIPCACNMVFVAARVREATGENKLFEAPAQSWPLPGDLRLCTLLLLLESFAYHCLVCGGGIPWVCGRRKITPFPLLRH